MQQLTQWYISFLDRKPQHCIEQVFAFFLYACSLLYTAAITVRNRLYDCGICTAYRSQKKIISIGNLSWSGSGKTTLALFLFDYCSQRAHTALLRRGYGTDEDALLRSKTNALFSGKNRVALVKKLSKTYDVFIVDDGFQYRALSRDFNIVVMGAREFMRPYRLIPAQIFREPLSSLQRADALIITYAQHLPHRSIVDSMLRKKFPSLPIFYADYQITHFFDLQNKLIRLEYFTGKRIAAVTAIGYPNGFFKMLRTTGIDVLSQEAYPDHHAFSVAEFTLLEQRLAHNGITDVIMTHKDMYHIPASATPKLEWHVMAIEPVIENKQQLLRMLSNKIFT